jgi:hypothetical protein
LYTCSIGVGGSLDRHGSWAAWYHILQRFRGVRVFRVSFASWLAHQPIKQIQILHQKVRETRLSFLVPIVFIFLWVIILSFTSQPSTWYSYPSIWLAPTVLDTHLTSDTVASFNPAAAGHCHHREAGHCRPVLLKKSVSLFRVTQNSRTILYAFSQL